MCLLVAILASLALHADGAVEPPTGVPPANEPPKIYKARHVAKPPALDGLLDDAVWTDATWSDAFVDIEGNAKPTPRYATRMKMVWDQTHLYIAAEMEEPDVWATYRTHDQIVFHENDFEVFIDPNGDGKAYYELEVNCLGTIFDLYLHRMYREGGPAFHRWNCKDLKTAIAIQGTVNDPRDVDSGWTLEWAIPFASLTPPRTELETDAAEAKRAGATPMPGESWRINFSRVQWQHNYEELDASGKRIGPKRPDARSGEAAAGDVPKYVKTPNVPENNWVWSPQGVIDMHLPDRWGFVTFVRE
jgi:Carbohydrate family 9 binding domain-like